MNKPRYVLLILFFSPLLFATTTFIRDSNELKTAQNSPTAVLTRGPYLQMASQVAVTLRWRTDLATDSRIEAGPAVGNYPLSATNPTVTTEHEVRIEGLSAGTRYYYRFGSSTQALQGGTDNFFLTAPPANTTKKLRIAAFGDCGKAGPIQTSVTNAYLKHTG